MRMTHNTDPRMHRTLLTLVFCFAFLVGFGSNAFGQSFDDLERKQQKAFAKLLDRCIGEYDRGRYERAEELCGQAADITPHPAPAYLVARIRDRTGKCEEAVALYKVVLDAPPAGASETRWFDEYRAPLEENLALLGDCSARLDVSCADDGAIVTVNGEALGTCPGIVVTVPGTLTVTLVAPGKAPKEKLVSVAAGRPQAVSFKALKNPKNAEGP